MYPKDTEKWKQFTTLFNNNINREELFCIPKILKNESNSQLATNSSQNWAGCFVSQRYWKMKAIHNNGLSIFQNFYVVLYPKDTEKWKQFTTYSIERQIVEVLFCIPKILKNESNSQQANRWASLNERCFVSQRYWKMKAIHN